MKDLTKFYQGPVYPIPPAFNEDGSLDFASVKKYIHYLASSGSKVFMTTAGTSQFNLLSEVEVDAFNQACCQEAYRHNCVLIAGLKPCHFKKMLYSIKTKNNEQYDAFLLLYPERFYGDKELIEYFHGLAEASEKPVFIHANSMRRGNGGNYSYSSNLIIELSKHEKIIGIKEEHPTLDESYKMCDALSSIMDEFVVIVAGGSQRRFTTLYPTGVKTYLSGIGSLYPEIENDFFSFFVEKKYEKAFLIQTELENLFFRTFMEIGWHKSFHEGLRQIGEWYKGERSPFPHCSREEKKKISECLKQIRERKGKK
jgi:dihydrodipicolinate synthase/N-acetylneuraminate lyase